MKRPPENWEARLIVLDQRVRNLWRLIGQQGSFSEEISDLSDELRKLAGRR